MALNVMVNGMPGPMALEVAQACLDRGFNLVPVGFTGLNQPASIQVVGATRTVDVQLQAGPGLGPDAAATMKAMKTQYPDLVVVDYTHPSAILNNLACYVDHNCEFVMGTTGGDPALMKAAFDKGTNLAVIAPNMGKQIVALQAALQEMAKRFPGSFAGYKLTVRGWPCYRGHHNGLTLSLIPLLVGDGVAPVVQGGHVGYRQGRGVAPRHAQRRRLQGGGHRQAARARAATGVQGAALSSALFNPYLAPYLIPI